MEQFEASYTYKMEQLTTDYTYKSAGCYSLAHSRL